MYFCACDINSSITRIFSLILKCNIVFGDTFFFFIIILTLLSLLFSYPCLLIERTVWVYINYLLSLDALAWISVIVIIFDMSFLHRFRRLFQQTCTIAGMKCCSIQLCHPWETSSRVLASTASTRSLSRRRGASVLHASLSSVESVGKSVSQSG